MRYESETLTSAAEHFCRWTVEFKLPGANWGLSSCADFVGTYAQAQAWAEENVRSGYAQTILAIRED